jgi:hypothetical protein
MRSKKDYHNTALLGFRGEETQRERTTPTWCGGRLQTDGVNTRVFVSHGTRARSVPRHSNNSAPLAIPEYQHAFSFLKKIKWITSMSLAVGVLNVRQRLCFQ